MSDEKRVSYQSKNTYSTLNSLGDSTKNFWLVFHGMGYLSKYFIKYFAALDPASNYVVAPQAPSKYYQGPDFKHVGASWLTRVDTAQETKNVLNYIDAVYQTEQPTAQCNFIVLGYSQGVSIATRWLASRKITCDHLVLHSGGIPKELSPRDFNHFGPSTKVTYLFGDKDPYITEARKTEETLRGTKLFGDALDIMVFDGVHEVNVKFLTGISK